MPSRTALREHKNAAAVMAAARRHRETVATTLIDRLLADGALEQLEEAPAPDEPIIAALTEELSETAVTAVRSNLEIQAEMAPVELPDLDNLQRFAVWAIAFYTVKMLQADDLLRQELQEDWVARRQRDEAARDAYDALVRMRRYVAGVLLDETAASSLLDLEGDTPTNPFDLRDTLAVAVQRLRRPESHFPDTRFEGAKPDWHQLADELEVVLVPLDQAIRRIEDEKAAADAALAEKRRAFELHRGALIGWRQMVQGMAIAGGDRELASRFTLPQPARRGLEDEADEVGDGSAGEEFRGPDPGLLPEPPSAPEPLSAPPSRDGEPVS